MYSSPSVLILPVGQQNMVFYWGHLKVKVTSDTDLPFGTKSSGLIEGGLKIKGCNKI